MKKLIEIKDLTKEFNGNIVLKGISLDIYENEFVTLLGPSGCGKTTTLRIIGGFEEATSGTVLFDSKNLLDIPPYERLTNTVFQHYALFPHMDVYDNVAYGLRIKEHISLFKRLKNNLNGKNKKVLKSKKQIEEEIKVRVLKLISLVGLKKIQRNLGITFIFVTHDQEEALTMSDKVVVMNNGEIQQVGTPIDVYNEPANRFVANFIGKSNIIDGIMIKDLLCSFDGKEFECVDKGFKDNENVDIVIRPEDIDIVKKDEGFFNGIVISEIFKGVHYEIHVQTENRDFLIHTTDYHGVNEEVGLIFTPDDIHIMEKMEW